MVREGRRLCETRGLLPPREKRGQKLLRDDDENAVFEWLVQCKDVSDL